MSSNLRSRLDRVEPRLVPPSMGRVLRVVSYARDPSTWNLAQEAEAGARADGWTGPLLVIDRRIVSPGDAL